MRQLDRSLSNALSVLVVLVMADFVVATSVVDSGPDSRVNYVDELNKLVQRKLDENLNAAPLYEQAFEAYVKSAVQIDSEDDIIPWPAELSAERRRGLKDWVVSNAKALAVIRQGTERPIYCFRYQGKSISEIEEGNLPEKTRELLWALIFRAKYRAFEGDLLTSTEDVLTGYRFAFDMKQKLLLHEQLVGIALVSFPLNAAFQILAEVDVNGTLMQSMQVGITAISRDRDYLIDLMPEKLLALESVRSVFGTSVGTETLVRADEAERVVARISALLGGDLSREQMYASLHNRTSEELEGLIEDGYAYYDSIVRKTPFAWKSEGIHFEEDVKKLTQDNLLLLILVPAAERASVLSFRCKATTDALVTTLALLRYGSDMSQLPASLSELVSSRYLERVPMDPYSDGPLVYRRNGDGFVLYSLGADFDDDGGTASTWGQGEEGGDQVFWPIEVNSSTAVRKRGHSRN